MGSLAERLYFASPVPVQNILYSLWGTSFMQSVIREATIKLEMNWPTSH